jgi:hypothetical protein
MRFRPANISLINRRHYLPRLLLTLSSKHENKNHANDSKMLTGSHHINFRFAGNTDISFPERRLVLAPEVVLIVCRVLHTKGLVPAVLQAHGKQLGSCAGPPVFQGPRAFLFALSRAIPKLYCAGWPDRGILVPQP